MWKRLSFRAQLFFPLGAMFLAALIMGIALLQMFATDQLIDEHQPARRAAPAVAQALNDALASSENPRRILQAFVQSLDQSAAIQFRSAEPVPLRPSTASALRQNPHGVPKWFVDLLAVPNVETAFPVTIEGKHVGDIVLPPDLSADLFEKWIGFLAFGGLVLVLAVLTGVIVYAIAGSALRPLRNLGEGLTRMRGGDYAQMIPIEGPPEIRQSCAEANALARTLDRMSQDNRDLLRRLVSLQDNERQALARELHDELGPVLFGKRDQIGTSRHRVQVIARA